MSARWRSSRSKSLGGIGRVNFTPSSFTLVVAGEPPPWTNCRTFRSLSGAWADVSGAFGNARTAIESASRSVHFRSFGNTEWVLEKYANLLRRLELLPPQLGNAKAH